MLLHVPAFASQKVTLTWQASASPDVVGYNVYYGLASRSYSARIPAASGTSALISGLSEGQTYYFAVTAYNAAGVESLPSAEISYQVPGVFLRLNQIQLGVHKALSVTSTGVVPFRWALQGSEDLSNWRTMTRGTNTSVDVTVLVSGASKLFFRLKGE